MKYERSYKEDPDTYMPIGEKDLREVLRQHYVDVETAVTQINLGFPIQTAFATYRKRENQDRPRGAVTGNEHPAGLKGPTLSSLTTLPW